LIKDKRQKYKVKSETRNQYPATRIKKNFLAGFLLKDRKTKLIINPDKGLNIFSKYGG